MRSALRKGRDTRGTMMALDGETETSDAALLARYAAGEQAAARALTFRHAPRVLALARRMLGDPAEAEDVAQETLLRMWKIAPEWREEARLSTWLYRVASNLCVDRLRRRREQGIDGAAEIADGAATAQEGLEARDRAGALRAALARLPDRQRAAIVLRHFEERPNPEIAEILGLSVEAVESLLARGRRALAERLSPRRSELGFADD
ncbi:RNA polymerase sigma factor [Amaricoccus solimangrovi]|uniref:RNA polymerase sigma factor n=1 Tax=Amaricoccus solimangrovi TaxID=2589815 RepID=A0A501WWJ5_9RHOB|nr:RNA polymerase sigma factor [Amaricoccus solimangrovi]TPE50246.1 RNA polymerase sigma factor [Amaricoccus solimangrovi]